MADDSAMELTDMASMSMMVLTSEEPAAELEARNNEETLLPPKPLAALADAYADDGAGSGSSADVTSSRDALVAAETTTTPQYSPPPPPSEKDAPVSASTEYWPSEEKETPLTGMASSIALFTGASEEMSSYDRAAAAKRMLTTWQLIGLSVYVVIFSQPLHKERLVPPPAFSRSPQPRIFPVFFVYFRIFFLGRGSRTTYTGSLSSSSPSRRR